MAALSAGKGGRLGSPMAGRDLIRIIRIIRSTALNRRVFGTCGVVTGGQFCVAGAQAGGGPQWAFRGLPAAEGGALRAV